MNDTELSDDPHGAALQASELIDRRRFEQARGLLGPALRRHPDHTALLFEAARADFMQDRNASARQTLQHLLGLAPHDVNGRWLMFLLEMDDGQLPEAEALVLGLLRDAPDTAQFYAGYCRLMLRALDFEKARALADEALKRAPNDDDSLRARALCDLIDRPGRADSAALAKLVASDPGDTHTLRLVVLALVHANRSRQALRLAQELLRMQPDDAHILNLVRALRSDNHWSLLPLWPLQRWGWYGSIGLWVGVILLMQLLRRTVPDAVFPVSMVVLAYVAYSWIWPPLLRRWLKRA